MLAIEREYRGSILRDRAPEAMSMKFYGIAVGDMTKEELLGALATQKENYKHRLAFLPYPRYEHKPFNYLGWFFVILVITIALGCTIIH